MGGPMRNLDLLIRQQPDATDSWGWATVVSSSPLSVRVDGDTDSLALTPVNLAGAVSAGDRVWVQTSGKRMVITGRAGGPQSAIATPTGAVVPYAGTTPPAGWIICDGRAVSRTTYAALFSVLGTTFGAGDGTTTFNVPNLSGRVPVGTGTAAGAAGATAHTLAQLGGEETHTMTATEMPVHNHTHGDNGNTHTWSWGGGNGTVHISVDAVAGAAASNNLWTKQGVKGFSSTNDAGGGIAHNNMQPYLGLNYIINALATTSGSTTLAGDSGWLALPYATGWSDFDPANWLGAAYRKIGNQVFVRGLVKNSAAMSAGTVYPVGTLPAGFRPPGNLILSGTIGNSSTRMDIMSTGIIEFVSGAAVSAGSYCSITSSFTID